MRFDHEARRIELSEVTLSSVGETVTAEAISADLRAGVVTAIGVRGTGRGVTGDARQVTVHGLLEGAGHLDLSRRPDRVILHEAHLTARGHRAALGRAELRRTEEGWAAQADGRLRRLADGREVRGTVGAALTGAGDPVSVTVDVRGLPLAWDPTGAAQRLHVGEGAVADATLRIARAGAGFEVSGTARLRDLSLQHWRLAPGRIGPLDLETEVTASWRPGALHVGLTDLRSGQAAGAVELTLTWPGARPAVDLRVRLPRQPCAELRRAVPTAMLAGLPDLVLSGETWLDAQLKVDLNVPRSLRLRIDGNLEGCQVETLGRENDRRLAGMRSRRFRHQPEVRGEAAGAPVGPATGDFVSYEEIPAWLRTAAIATEDRGFFDHRGLRLALIRGALKLNLEEMRYVYGGSTITQQLVKNLFLTRRKDLARKLEEAVIAVQVERTLSKERILELYLNCIEYGPGIWGLTRAARAYYGKEVAELTPTEGVYLMAIKPYPTHGWHNARRGHWRANWIRRMRYIFERIHRMGAIDADTLEAAGPDFRPIFVLTPFDARG